MTKTDQDQPEELRRRRAAIWASILLPGLGHLYSGRRRRARWLFVTDAILAVSALIVVFWFRLDAVKIWVSPDGLLLIIVLNFALLGFRALIVMDSYDLPPSGSSARALGKPSLVLATLVLVIPHFILGSMAYAQYDLITTVFADTEPSAAPTPATPTTTADPSLLTGSDRESYPSPTQIPETTPPSAVPALWDGLKRLNIVLLGADAGEGRRGLRTDTTIVVSIDPSNGDVAMFSVPRDLSDAPLPEGMGLWDCDCFPDLITHLYDSAVRNPTAFPGPSDPPINAIKGALGEIFGIPIHYYALVTLDGFVGMVDALGGVTMEIPSTIVDETYPHEDGSIEHVVIEAGTQHLDGHLALAYARIRRHSNDFARMHRQRCVLEAMVEQTNPLEVVARFPALASAVKENVETDIPQDRLADFVDLLPKLDSSRIATLRITREQYKTGSGPGRVYYDIDRIRVDAQELMTDPAAAQERLGLGSLDATCS